MSVRLLAIAQEELDEAIAYYSGQAAGLGDAFLLETITAIDRIRRFPHLHRRPDYWRDRMNR